MSGNNTSEGAFQLSRCILLKSVLSCSVKVRGLCLMTTGSNCAMMKQSKKMVRFRTLGCYPPTGGIESDATDIGGIIKEQLESRYSERQGRLIDSDARPAWRRKLRVFLTRGWLCPLDPRPLRGPLELCSAAPQCRPSDGLLRCRLANSRRFEALAASHVNARVDGA